MAIDLSSFVQAPSRVFFCASYPQLGTWLHFVPLGFEAAMLGTIGCGLRCSSWHGLSDRVRHGASPCERRSNLLFDRFHPCHVLDVVMTWWVRFMPWVGVGGWNLQFIYPNPSPLPRPIGNRTRLGGRHAVRLREDALRSTFATGGAPGSEAAHQRGAAHVVRRTCAWTDAMASRRPDVRVAAVRTRHRTRTRDRMHTARRERRRRRRAREGEVRLLWIGSKRETCQDGASAQPAVHTTVRCGHRQHRRISKACAFGSDERRLRAGAGIVARTVHADASAACAMGHRRGQLQGEREQDQRRFPMASIRKIGSFSGTRQSPAAGPRVQRGVPGHWREPRTQRRRAASPMGGGAPRSPVDCGQEPGDARHVDEREVQRRANLGRRKRTGSRATQMVAKTAGTRHEELVSTSPQGPQKVQPCRKHHLPVSKLHEGRLQEEEHLSLRSRNLPPLPAGRTRGIILPCPYDSREIAPAIVFIPKILCVLQVGWQAALLRLKVRARGCCGRSLPTCRNQEGSCFVCYRWLGWRPSFCCLLSRLMV